MKVTYQHTAVVDIAHNLLVTPEGMEPKIIRLSMAASMISGGNFNKLLIQKVKEEFGITDEIELEDVTPPMPELSGGDDHSFFFGSGCCCCCSHGFGR